VSDSKIVYINDSKDAGQVDVGLEYILTLGNTEIREEGF
jgi:hypothetical protein